MSITRQITRKKKIKNENCVKVMYLLVNNKESFGRKTQIIKKFIYVCGENVVIVKHLILGF